MAFARRATIAKASVTDIARRASPSARDTVAEMAMVRPIETDSATNCNWLA